MTGDKRVRPWSFWRKAFWTRPALLALYGVAALVFVPFGVHQTAEAVGAGRAVSAHRLCDVDADGPCLERIGGSLNGPFGQRKTVNAKWQVSVIEGFETGPQASDDLERWKGDVVSALTYDGDVVVIETPDGRSYESLGAGTRGVAQWACVALLGLFGGVALLRYALRKRRASGGWWRVEGPTIPAAEVVDLPVVLGVAVSGVSLGLMQFGAPWWLALGLTAVVVAATGLAIARSRRRSAQL